MAERMTEKLSVYDIVHEMRMSRNFLVQTLVGHDRDGRNWCHAATSARGRSRVDDILHSPPRLKLIRFSTATCTCLSLQPLSKD